MKASAPAGPTAVLFKQVTATYGQLPVLREVDLALAPRQTHVILGPSGCGKSTLLRCLTGILIPKHGTVLVMGRPVEPASAPSQRTANQAMGLVLQDGGLFPHLTGRANMTLPAELNRWSGDRIEARLAELEGLVGLSKTLRDRYPRALSGGQRQRVALIRALFLDPPLLLLDEPFSALDPLSRTELQHELKAIVAVLGKTVVLVTHDIPEALFLADTITLLDDGRVAQHGSGPDLIRHPASAWASSFMQAAAPRWRHLLAVLDGGEVR
jgi:osmoprotectant transport system ATP-binding protein